MVCVSFFQVLARDPFVEKLTSQAQEGEEVEFTPDLMKNEVRPELVKFLNDTYSRMAVGESDPVDDLGDLVSAMSVDTNHRFNFLESQMRQSEARIMAAITGQPEQGGQDRSGDRANDET